ncbi:cytochrome P450 [Glonium stellatum]|uniref:Cytochrome P450 n=1 Tax=Glonium stellatum TaxID=574774 RepID=A0A8E2JZ74_9PEZI|nr:cytochrome P450 [Glonium stellatum]
MLTHHTSQIMKSSDKPFVVRWWAKDYIIMPSKYLTDLRTAGWSHLSFFRNINDALFLHLTTGDLYTSPISERMAEVVKKGVNPRLPQLTQIMVDEINDAFEKGLRNLPMRETEGNVVKAIDFFARVAHQTASRVMIGTELCRDEIFLRGTMSLLESIFNTAVVIVKLPLGPFRGILAWPLTLAHRWRLQKCADMLRPTVSKRLELRQKAEGQNHQDENLDAIEWTLDLCKGDSRYDTVDWITEELLHNLWAASSAPGGLMTQVVYQLLTEPHYMIPLREEAIKAVEEFGWSEKMLSRLNLQDSFIREVNRLFPTGSITCSRTVIGRPFKFSDGLTLPVGSRFGFPIKAFQCDTDNFADPLKFDGFRFVKQALNENGVAETARRWTATGMGTTNLAWGYGNHVCPGRFFAVRETKLVITKLLLEFDVSWDRESKLGRPASVNVEGQFVPNLQQSIRLRRRT